MYRRLAILRHRGLVAAERVGAATFPVLLRLTRRGWGELRADGGSVGRWGDSRPRPTMRLSSVAHELAITDVHVGFCRATRMKPEVRLEVFATSGPVFDRLRRTDAVSRRFLRPDAYLRQSHTGHVSHFFVELDRATQAEQVIQAKAAAYRRLRQRGVSAGLDQSSDWRPGVAPFRVLFVCPSAARRDHLARSLLTLTPPVLTQCWFATLDDVTRDATGAIWRLPVVYRNPSSVPSADPPLVALSP